MSCALENLDTCLPITAIQVLNILGHRLILSGHGPYIVINDDATSQVLERRRVFQRNNVHGIQVLNSTTEEPKRKCKILVWGGQSLRLLEIGVQEPRSEERILFSILTLEFVCPDWILDVSFRDSPTSDLDTLPSYQGCLITAHNVIFGLELIDKSESANIGFQLHEIAPDLKPILYSADIIWTSSGQILVAAGTVFGEIIVWTCDLGNGPGESLFANPTISIHHFFTGHEGSIFGVDISKEVQFEKESSKRRFLASCSDDRTIRVWDISACDSSLFREGDRPAESRGLRSTGFGAVDDDTVDLGREACVAKTMGHVSRIWGIYFLDISLCQENLVFNLLSRGEDTTCQVWKFKLQQSLTQESHQLYTGNVAINHISTHGYHTGKNIWSVTTCKGDKAFHVYSGGADGNLVSFTLDRRCSPVRTSGELMESYSADEVASLLGLKDNSAAGKAKKEGRLAYYAFVSDDSFIATTSQGKVLLGQISPGSSEQEALSRPLVSWSIIATIEGLGSPGVFAGNPREHVGIIGLPNGAMWLYHHRTRSIESVISTESTLSEIFMVDGPSDKLRAPGSEYISFVSTFVNKAKAVFFTFQYHPAVEPVSEIVLMLPPDFVVTAALFVKKSSWLVLGSRHGGLAVYALDAASDSAQIDPIFHAPHLHANDAVTSITGLETPDEQRGTRHHVITTGRDGYYQLHSIEHLDGPSQPLTMQTLHKASPPFGPNVEGATLDPRTNELVLYGFKGAHFIVWNESTQTELMAAECGGCHRVWTFNSDDQGRRAFIWNKATRFNIFSSQAPSHRIVRAGGHGREIKSACLSGPLVNAGSPKTEVLATGAEDTTLRLFLPRPKGPARSGDRFNCQRTLKKHTAGVQHLQWSPCRRFLLSSSGCEELFIWRIRSIPGFGIGAVLVGECPKSKPVSDLRITHFDVLRLGNKDAFLLALAYSNSTVTIFYYEPNSSGGSFELVAQGQYSTNCLTYIRFVVSGQRLYLLTTSTDGHLATWDLTNSLSSVFQIHDNTANRLEGEVPTVPFELECGGRHAIHQSSIKAMEMLQVSEIDVLVFCGGDDNALSVSRISLPTADSMDGAPSLSSTPLPHAHASAINAVTVIGDMKHQDMGYSVTIASSGNDQRLKVWSVKVSQQAGDKDVEITLTRNSYTAIADISSVDVLTTDDDGKLETHLVVCGVGMDMWKVDGA